MENAEYNEVIGLIYKIRVAETNLNGEDKPLTNSIYKTKKEISKKLTMVPTYMKEFTLHDITHCDNILYIINNILPNDVQLNLIELYLLITATLLHDVGMAPSEELVDEILHSEEYIEFEEKNNTFTADELHSEFIRKHHVIYSVNYVEELFKSNKLEKYRGVDLSRWIKSIIKGHELSVEEIEQNVEDFPSEKLIDEFKVNVRFLALLLRLGDVLDFDNSRTPEILYSHISPKNKVSIAEWEKHLSVSGKVISPRYIKYDINSDSIKIERKVKNFIKYIEEEITNTNRILKGDKNGYTLQLSNEVNLNVTRDGYIYNTLEIEIYYDNIVKILMGTHLYVNPYVFLRELIQNSYDACNYRKFLMDKSGEIYEPFINVRYNTNTYELSIEDNGYGIDEEIFKEYVIKIGKSFFRTKKLTSNNKKITLISKFGIGLLSNFMVSDTIVIESKIYSPDKLKGPIHYEMNIDDTYINQNKSNRNKIGTKIILKIKSDFNQQLNGDKLEKSIKENMACQNIPINVTVNDNNFVINDKISEIIDIYKNIRNVIVIQLEDIEGLEGAIILSKNISYNTAPDSLVGYKGFKVKNGKETLIPIEWLSNYAVIINIDDPIVLDLNASREKFILDDNLIKLRKEIINKLINYMKEKLQNVNLFISESMSLNLHKYSKEIINFLFENINCKEYDTVNCNTKDRSIKDSIVDVLKNNGKIIIIEEEMLNEGCNLKQVLKEIRDYNIVLTEPSHTGYIRQFIEPMIKTDVKVVSKVSGCIYNKIELNTDKELESIKYEFKDREKKNVEFEDDNIFMIIGQEGKIMLDIQYNIKHPFSILLEEYKNTLSVRKFKDLFECNIFNNMLNEKEKLTSLNQDFKEDIFFLVYRKDYFKNAINFINKMFLNEINKYIVDELIKGLENEKGVIITNIKDYKLKRGSFPKWYWEE